MCSSGAFCDGVIAYQSVDVYTRDGKRHHTRRLLIAPKGLRLYSLDNRMEPIARDAVVRIKVRPRGRHLHHIQEAFEWASLPLELAEDSTVVGGLLATALTPPLFAGAMATAPVFLLIDAFTFFAPAQTYEIIP